MKKLTLLLMIWCCAGCGRHNNIAPVQITPISNGQAIKITGPDKLIVAEIARDTAFNFEFEALVPVYRMPADTEMKDFQKSQPGKYSVNNGELLFTPDTPFRKGQTYFVRYYQYSTHNTIWDFLSNRKSIRGIKHIDLIFKP